MIVHDVRATQTDDVEQRGKDHKPAKAGIAQPPRSRKQVAMHVSRIGWWRGESRHRHPHANIHERVREPMRRHLHTLWLSSPLGKPRVEDQQPWNVLLRTAFQDSTTDAA